MRETADAAIGLCRRDWLTFASYRTQLISMVLGLFTTLTIYHFISKLVRVTAFPTPQDYFAFLVVGMVIFQVLQSTMGVAGALRGELVAGTFERLLLSPFGAVRAVISMMVFPFVMSLVSSIILLALAATIFGVPLTWSTAWLALPLTVLGTGIFTSFGMLFAATTLVFKRAAGGLGFVVTLITLTSGVYFPIALLPGWMQWFSEIQPFTAAVDLLRNVLVGRPLDEPAWLEISKMAGFLVVMVPLGVIALQASLRFAQKRGTIVEY
jgi:ABC-type polysaccharide/polyol phosphate export permease